MNAFVNALESRIAASAAANVDSSSMRKLADAKQIFSNEKIVEFATANEVDASFAMRKVNAADLFCIKSIELVAKVANALVFNTAKFDTLKTVNTRVILKTLLNLANADKEFSDEVFLAAMNKKVLASMKNSELKKLIECRNDEYDSAKRQISMYMNMLKELKLIKQVSANTYKANDNLAVSKLKEMFA